MSKELTLVERLNGIQHGVYGAARRIKSEVARMELLEKHLKKDATVLAIFRLHCETIRFECDHMVDKEPMT